MDLSHSHEILEAGPLPRASNLFELLVHLDPGLLHLFHVSCRLLFSTCVETSKSEKLLPVTFCV